MPGTISPPSRSYRARVTEIYVPARFYHVHIYGEGACAGCWDAWAHRRENSSSHFEELFSPGGKNSEQPKVVGTRQRATFEIMEDRTSQNVPNIALFLDEREEESRLKETVRAARDR